MQVNDEYVALEEPLLYPGADGSCGGGADGGDEGCVLGGLAAGGRGAILVVITDRGDIVDIVSFGVEGGHGVCFGDLSV